MTKDEALRMALEAICGSGDFLFNWHDCEPNNEREMQSYQAVLAANEKAFTAIREVLAQPEVWVTPKLRPLAKLAHEQPAQQQEPPTVAELLCVCGAEWEWRNRDWEPVSTPPPRKPLTDEEILKIGNSCALKAKMTSKGVIIHSDGMKRFVRAVEQAHGIKGEA